MCWPFRREMYEKATRMTTNRRKSRRTTMGRGSSGCLSILGYGEFRRGSPQPVELVKIPDAVQEDVHHEIVVVDQYPPPLAYALHPHRAKTVLLERFLGGAGGGVALPVGRSRAKEKVIGEGGVFPDVQRPDGGGFFLLGKARALDHRIPCGYCRPSSPEPRYRPCSAMYSSTSDGTRPRMHFLLRTFSRMELEEISRAGRAGQYNLRPPGRR